MGRPSKLDDLRAKRIVDALKAGHSFAAAARAGGIDEATLHRWRGLGADGEEGFRKFYERVNEACQVAEDRCVQVIKSALEGEDLKLATDTAWKWLARRRPVEWADQKAEPLGAAVAVGEADDGDLAIVESVAAAIKSRKQVA